MFCGLLYSLLIPACLLMLFKYLNAKYKPPVLGIYQLNKNRNYWIKFVSMFLFLKLRQLYNHLRVLRAVETGKSSDGAVHILAHELDLENKYFLGDNPTAIDAVYYNGLSDKGDVIICGLARRPGHVVDSFMYLKVEGEELLLSPCLPDTYQVQTIEEAGEYKIQGLEIVNYVPMRAWKVLYNGEMKPRSDSTKKLKVQMELTWSASWSPFNYDTQMSATSMANDLAREQWSADYFKLLKKFHQTHYEQMGYIKGTVSIDGRKHEINVPCVRDHSFGPFRDWRTIHRYVYHFIFLENGDCMAIGTVCQPAVMSHLTIGYLCCHSDQSVLPVSSCDFQLYQHGENQILPKDYGFSFEVAGQVYTVKVEVNDEEIFYIGKDRVSKFYDRWCTVQVNGVNGRACVEWQYNNEVSK